METEGEKLRYVLKIRGITQDDAASALGVSRMTINSWCNRYILDENVKTQLLEKLQIDISNVQYENAFYRKVFDLKTFRKERGISQRDIMSILDISQPYASEIENNKKALPKHLYDILEEKYGRDIIKYLKPDKGTHVQDIYNSTSERIKELEAHVKLCESIIDNLKDKNKLLEDRIKDKEDMINILQNKNTEVVKAKM